MPRLDVVTQPSGLKNLLRAAAGALPFLTRGDSLPDRMLTVDELAIDPANVAAYANVTGLRFGDTVEIDVTVARLGSKSITFRYRIYRAADALDAADARPRTLSAQGTVICAVVDLARFVAIGIPARVVEMLADLREDSAKIDDSVSG